MSTIRTRLIAAAIFAAAAIVASAVPALAQGGATSTLAGTVTDSSGAVIPGANVSVKNDATGTVYEAVTGANGAFTIPAIPPGTYTATIALQGFKTAILKDVIVNVGVPASVKATLEIGGLEETVTVGGASEIVQTQSTSVAQTLNSKQIANLPMQGRAAFDLVQYMPGVASTDGSSRGSTVNGLPQSAVNITLDGMNIQDNFLKTSDGMFTRVNPRIDAVEEFTMSTASQGADIAGQGGVQVKFVTRSGTNRYQGSAYYYLRREWMNTNTWFNTHRNLKTDNSPSDKPVINQQQPGFRMGGPISIPGLFDGRDKLFFFVNYEELRSPGTRIDTRTIMSPTSEHGLFTYAGGMVDLMALAAANGQTSRIDPLVGKLIADVRASTSQGGVQATTDPLTQSFSWTQPTKSTTKYPTVRVDYNATSKHRVTFSMTRNHLISDPDTTNSQQRVYPGFPVHGLQDSVRYSGQGSVRSTLTNNIVNEFRYGATGGATFFSPDLNTSMYSGQSVGDMNGYSLSGGTNPPTGWNVFKGIANPSPSSANSSREGSTRVFEDTVNWIKGSHALSMGGGVTRAKVWLYNQQLVPTINLGIATGDPADAMFTNANFPNASATDLTNAKNLYAVLTGRITSIGRNARIGDDGTTFTILGPSNQYGRLNQWGTFIQDSWRVRQNLTINAGLRYDVQQPFYALNDSYSMATMDDIFGVTGTGAGFVPGSVVTDTGNLFKPGTLQGAKTTFKQFPKNTKGYNTDWGNIAPSAGAAWTIGSNEGLLHRIFGSPGDSVIRGGYSRAFQRGGMSDFTGVYGGNPGIAIDTTRNQTNGNLGTLPVLLSSSDLGAPPTNLTRTFPMQVPNASSSVFAFDPNIKTPYADSYTIGWQRALARDMSVEARFIHTKSVGTWTLGGTSGYLNYNELNILSNHFVDEFRVAQANLVANVAAGRGNTFAYTGVAGTSPLPIFLAYLSGSTAVSDPTKYSGTGWTNTSLVQSMFALNPNPLGAANQIRTTASFLTNAAAAGMPANFFVANPDVSQANVVANGPDTRYNGVQFVLNRRFADGFLLQSAYSYGKGYEGAFYSFRRPYQETEQTFTNSDGSASGNVRHVWSTNWLYELPFGRGRAFGADSGAVMDRIIGHWNFQGVARLQSGRLLDFGNVRLVGMTADDLRKAFQVRKAQDPANSARTLVYMLPQDIIDNTIKAFSVTATGYSNGMPSGRYFAPQNGPDCLETMASSTASATAGFGDCGVRSLIVTGPKVVRFDMSIVKQIAVAGSVVLETQLQVFNVFNNVNFNPVTGAPSGNIGSVGSNPDSYQVTGAVDQSRTMQMAFRISW